MFDGISGFELLSFSVTVLGVLVSGGAWIYAAKANKKSKEVKAQLVDISEELEQRIKDVQDEEARRSIPPVNEHRVNFVLEKNLGGSFHLRNVGQGAAYNVVIEPGDEGTILEGGGSFGVVKPYRLERVYIRARDEQVKELTLKITWQEYDEGPLKEASLRVLNDES